MSDYVKQITDLVRRRAQQRRSRGETHRQGGNEPQAGYYHGGADALEELASDLEALDQDITQNEHGG